MDPFLFLPTQQNFGNNYINGLFLMVSRMTLQKLEQDWTKCGVVGEINKGKIEFDNQPNLSRNSRGKIILDENPLKWLILSLVSREENTDFHFGHCWKRDWKEFQKPYSAAFPYSVDVSTTHSHLHRPLTQLTVGTGLGLC